MQSFFSPLSVVVVVVQLMVQFTCLAVIIDACQSGSWKTYVFAFKCVALWKGVFLMLDKVSGYFIP